MTYRLSPGLVDTFPTIDELLGEIRAIACSLDRGIGVRDLRVEAKCNNSREHYKGWAYPLTRLRDGNGATYHRDGLIRMQIGKGCEQHDVVRLYAHELRHIGQFHRGRRRHGFMTINPLSINASERDAEEFEERVLERMAA